MKVLMVSQTYYPFLAMGGPPVKVRALATRLAKAGHAVTVLTADLGLTEDGLPSLATKPTNLGWEANENGVRTIYLRSQARHRAVTLNWGLRGFCASELAGFDVVHIYGLYDLFGPVVARRCAERNIPYLLEPIGMFRPIARSLALKRIYHRLVGERLFRGAAAVIATSEQEKQELLQGRIPSRKIVIRRNGVEAPATLPERGIFRGPWKISPETKLILFLGRLTPKKNPGVAVEAFARWQRQGDAPGRAMLAVAGPEEDRGFVHRLRQSAGRLGVESQVLFPGPVFGDAKWAAYRDADIFILPSQNENFGNSAAESAACGTPVIVTDQCGVAPFVEGRAGLVIPCGVEPLVEALSKMLNDARLRERYREGCAAMTRQLSWEEPAAELENLYARCIAEAGRP